MRVSIRAPHEGAVGEATGGREAVTDSASAVISSLPVIACVCVSLPDRDGGSPDVCVGAIHLVVFCVTRPSHPGRSGDVRRGLL